MSLRLYNTLTNREDAFEPLEAGVVRFYTCGPTVYDYAHIGNFRTFLASDVLRRWLESPLCARVLPGGGAEADPLAGLDETLRAVTEAGDVSTVRASGEAAGGYRVAHVMNITDVGHMTDDQADDSGEDRMEVARQRLTESKKAGTLPDDAPDDLDPANPHHIAAFYGDAFVRDAAALGIRLVREAMDEGRDALDAAMPRATGSIDEILRLVLDLLERGYAYVVGDVCYFDTARFAEYGTLSGNTLDAIRSGAGGRVDERNQAAKRHPADFMLWKHDPRHLMKWDPAEVLAGEPALVKRAEAAGLREGYPGWHIECSAMARTRLGDVIDIHSGGEDLIFPHHECEIAQSRGASGEEAFARYWMHCRFLQVEGEKMSKSRGNFFTARQILGRGFTPGALRLALVGSHYRQNANFTASGLSAAEATASRWGDFIARGDEVDQAGSVSSRVVREFVDSMNSDLNVAGAIGAINAWVNRTPSPTRSDAALMRVFDDVLGVVELVREGEMSEADRELADQVETLIRARAEARKNRDFEAADRIRDEATALGVELVDTPDGTTWKRKARLG